MGIASYLQAMGTKWEINMELRIEKVSWDQVSKSISLINPPLFKIIEEISPRKQDYFIKAYYPFGTAIHANGQLNIPTRSKMSLPLSFKRLPPEIRKQLGYASMPLTLIINKASEEFTIVNDEVFSLSFNIPGDFLGLTNVMNSFFNKKSCYDTNEIIAGARSLLTLPSLSDKQGQERLRKMFHLPFEVIGGLTQLKEQWNVFKYISDQENFDDSWMCEILFFPQHWFDLLQKNNVFYNYIFKEAWSKMNHALNFYEEGFMWGCLSENFSKQNLRIDFSHIDIVKHLFSIINEKNLAWVPINNSNLVAPIDKFKNIITDVYQLKEYYPQFMYADKISRHQSVYYSLYYSLFSSKDKKTNKIMSNLKDIKNVIDRCSDAIPSWANDKLFKNFEFGYFNTSIDKEGDILLSDTLVKTDKRFLQNDMKDKKFALHSAFWKGAIKIKNKLFKKANFINQIITS